MYGVILFFHILVAFLLVVVILMQQRGGGLSTVFGGSSESVFGGGGAAPFMIKLTSILAAVFAITSLSLVLMTKARRAPVTPKEKPVPTQPVPFEKAFPESAKGGK